jgi:hypothetical protein
MNPIAKCLCITIGLLSSIAFSQTDLRSAPQGQEQEAEFHMVRVKHNAPGGGGSRGYYQPYWAIDYPLAEAHFLASLKRLSRVDTTSDSIHLDLNDPRIFDYPFLFLQQPGKGWRPSDQEAGNLREYLLRGGFLLVDDFHGEHEWDVFYAAIHKVFPDRSVVEIPEDDAIMNLVFTVDQHTPLPGRRHLWVGSDGQTQVYMQGPTHWRGIYDDEGRVMVAMNFNSDMGDAWEHEDDPVYPLPMTALAHKMGTNYVVYAMTH